MILSRTLILMFCGMLPQLLAAWDTPTHNIRVTTHRIASTYMKQERDIQIYLPASYERGTQSYPVLYILDGQQYFYNGVAYEKSFTHFDRAPEFMVVGVENYHPQRLLSLSETPFLDFLEHELIPYIEKTYRANKDRLIFGWQSGGNFVTHLLLNRPHLFNAYFAASGVTSNLQSEPLDRFLAESHGKRPKYVYFTLGAGEPWSTKRMANFSDLLAEKEGNGLKWTYELLEEEDHWSTPYRTIYRGLLNYYHDFRPLKFRDLAEFEEKGGLAYLEKHYAARGEKYNVSKDIHRRTIFNLLSRAMRADNYPFFDQIMARFGESQLEDWYKWDHWSRFLHRYGQFYLKHHQPDKALTIFQAARDKFPEEAHAYNDLGQVYQAKGNLEEARSHYKRAVTIAQTTDDPGLKRYQADLNSLTK